MIYRIIGNMTGNSMDAVDLVLTEFDGDKDLTLPPHFVLFGGGWKNPIVRQSFEELIAGKGYVLPEHQQSFQKLLNRFDREPTVKYSAFGEMMEARLFADLARYNLENKPWEIPEIVQSGKRVVCGVLARPGHHTFYRDDINLAAKGWQDEQKYLENQYRQSRGGIES